MVLINDDLRAINRNIGVIWGAVNVEDAKVRAEYVCDALEVIENTLDEAEKREVTLGTIMCEFCGNGDHLNATLTDKYGSKVKMSYCPICGRKLEGWR